MKSSGLIPSIGTINNEKDSDGEDSIQSSDLSSNTSSDDSASLNSGSGEDKKPREYVKPTVTQSKFVRLKKQKTQDKQREKEEKKRDEKLGFQH